ncbi:ferritin-like domain-containing protein [Geobacter metallireducens]|nr:ferritin family protein [Geobacter metallireducens]
MYENKDEGVFETVLKKAVKFETDNIHNYLDAMNIVRNEWAKKTLRRVALAKLVHKNRLEKALIKGRLESSALTRPVPTMNLHYVLPKKMLHSDSDAREALAYAIHVEKGAIDFYNHMANESGGAQNDVLFGQLLAEESLHLQILEDLYEEYFLPEN